MNGPQVQLSRIDVARLVRELREAASLTQAELASRLGVQQSFVSKYEAGERKLDIVELHEICRATGASFEKVAAELERRWSARP